MVKKNKFTCGLCQQKKGAPFEILLPSCDFHQIINEELLSELVDDAVPTRKVVVIYHRRCLTELLFEFTRRILIRNHPSMFPCVYCIIDKVVKISTEEGNALIIHNNKNCHNELNTDTKHRTWCNEWWKNGDQKIYKMDIETVKSNDVRNLFECSTKDGKIVHVMNCNSIVNDTVKKFLNRNLQDVYASVGAVVCKSEM